MKCPYCIKVCSKCNKILVAYSGNFAKVKKGKYGYMAECKECYSKRNKQYYEENKEEIAERRKEYNKQYYEEHKEEHAEYMKKYGKEYRIEHKEEIAEYKKQYYEEHKEEKAEYQKQYYEEHKEEIAEYNKQYRESNPHIVFNKNVLKRVRINNIEVKGRITSEQWYEVFNFFNNSCAYSEEELTNNKTLDHIIPLSKGGTNEIWNVIPCSRSCNSSKQDKEFLEWYEQQEFFSEERLQKIYEWQIYAYNKWGTI